MVPTIAADPRQAIKYPAHSPFWAELNRRVDGYFAETGKSTSGGAALRWKSAVILAWVALSWAALVLWAGTWWQALPAAVSLSLAVAGVGFNIQHDGGHDAFSRSRRANRVAAFALDLVGGSSYVWKHKHSVIHHHFTNIHGVDEDIEAEPFLRLSPRQPRRAHHRFQHWYAWALFGFLPPKWAFWDDFHSVATGKVGSQTMPRPGARDLALLLLGKVLFVGWVFVLPMLAGHSFGRVLGMYAFCSLVTGIALSTVFQAAHCVEEAEFPDAPAAGDRMERGWAEHQLATTVDFAPRSPLVTWYLGGLTHQIEHHLFPRISHVHYPAIAPIVREVCAEYGVAHRTQPHFRTAVASHVRHLRRLGRADTVPAAA